MAQVNGTDTPAVKNGSGNLFASLRASFNLDSVKNGLFSSLLAQSKSHDPLPSVTQDQIASAADSQNPDNSSSGATLSAKQDILASNSDIADEDAARVRDLLKQVRDDINELRNSQKRDQEARSKEIAADKKAQAKDAKVDDSKPVAAQEKKCDDVKPEVKETAATGAQDKSVKTKETAEVSTTEAAEKTLVTATAEDAKPTTGATADDKSTNDILADLIQTEQALMLMLQQMMQEKTAKGQSANAGAMKKEAAATGTVDAVKNANVKDAAKGMTDAGLAAAFGADASSVDAVAEKPADGAALLNDKKPAASIVLPQMADEKAAAKEIVANKSVDLAAMFHPVNNDAPAPAVVVPLNTALAAGVAKGAGAAEAEGANEFRAVTATPANTNTNPVSTEGARPIGSYDFASQLSAQRATKGGAAGLPPAVEQVALQLHKMVKDGVDQMTLQLRPAELGRIDIKLQFAKDGSNTVTGTVIADSQSTLDMLQKDSGGLQRALQDAGLRTDSSSLQFSLRDDGQQNAFAQNNNGQQQSQGNGYGGYGSRTDDTLDTAATDVEETYYLTPGRVNLRV